MFSIIKVKQIIKIEEKTITFLKINYNNGEIFNII